MRVPYDGGLGRPHSAPAFERHMILVDHGHHHLANIEGLLAPGIGFVRKNVTNAAEAVFILVTVRKVADVATDRIGCGGLPWEPFAGSDVGVIVVPHKNVAGLVDVASPILRLP